MFHKLPSMCILMLPMLIEIPYLHRFFLQQHVRLPERVCDDPFKIRNGACGFESSAPWAWDFDDTKPYEKMILCDQAHNSNSKFRENENDDGEMEIIGDGDSNSSASDAGSLVEPVYSDGTSAHESRSKHHHQIYGSRLGIQRQHEHELHILHNLLLPLQAFFGENAFVKDPNENVQDTQGWFKSNQTETKSAGMPTASRQRSDSLDPSNHHDTLSDFFFLDVFDGGGFMVLAEANVLCHFCFFLFLFPDH